jgi:hypothetical protein
MTSKYNSLDYELESRLRSRLFDATDAHLKMSLFEVLSDSHSNKLYVNNTIAFHNPLWNELKQSN